MRILFDFGSSCQRNFANQARARHNMRYLLQQSGRLNLAFRSIRLADFQCRALGHLILLVNEQKLSHRYQKSSRMKHAIGW
jgi:hypothetical protein